jgi:DNA-binding NtrC family response regulator
MSTRLQVLVVDDHATVREGLIRILTGAGLGWHVQEAANAEVALGLADQCSFDVGVVDMSMPGMNGIVFVQTYHARGGAAPVLMMDKNADRMKVVEALKAGVVSFLLRPIEPDVFAQHILRCLMKRKSA